MKHLELFAGIGGFRCGIEFALSDIGQPSECVGFSEIDNKASMVYTNYFGAGSLEMGDIVQFCNDPSNIASLPNFDLLTGGFPCQPFSLMGKKLGFDDERGTMFFYILKILTIKRPKYILLENVKNLHAHSNGNTFRRIFEELTSLGYDVQYDIVNSSDFGLAQTRNRVYILGTLIDEAHHFDFNAELVKEHFSGLVCNKKLQLQNSVCDVLDKSADEKFFLSEKIKPTILSNGSGGFMSNSTINLEIARPLTASMHKMHRACQDNYYSENFIKSGGALHDEKGLDKAELCQLNIRRLTPSEAYSLQGFPQDFIEKTLALRISNGSMYKQAGNAVSVNVVYAIMSFLLSRIYDEHGNN